jgi:L-serine dehydratase
MMFYAYNGEVLLKTNTYYSVGGGFVVNAEAQGIERIVEDQTTLPYPFTTGQQLLKLCQDTGLSISSLMLENEKSWRDEATTKAELLNIWSVMQNCVKHGCHTEGILPGGLKVKRRAPLHYRQLQRSNRLMPHAWLCGAMVVISYRWTKSLKPCATQALI